ncbi:MAG: SpoIIE family protein phosphatase [Bacteroidetes bacterium]|nr:SpoIIE family protein phosphatase [Bacteroidota bacterium]
MDNILFQSYIIEDRSYVAFIKREIHNLVRLHFSETRTAEIDIVVSEMTSNLIKYAKKGELLYRVSSEAKEIIFEIICIDSGPGIKDIIHSAKDGVSTKGTLGQGIGSIMRLSNVVQFYSQQGWGTIVYSKFYNSPDHKISHNKVIVRCINVAKPGEQVSGDGLCVRTVGDKTMILMGDGLGHGSNAKAAVDTAISTFKTSMIYDPAEMIREMHANVKKTRGLVATVASLDYASKQWQVCGVGNIATRLQRGLEYKNYISNNGIIGLNIPTRLENNLLEMEKFQQMIFCSDGIKTNWDLTKYPSILKYDPMILAAALYKEYARLNDDMTILIVKVL